MLPPATSTAQILIHLRWAVADADASPRTEAAAWERLPVYVLRYAETLGARVHAVGGMNDHLHVLLEIPPAKSLQTIEDELRRASQRFLRDVLGDKTFAWASEGGGAISVSPAERSVVAWYVETQPLRHAAGDLRPELERDDETPAPVAPAEELPEWLRSVLPKTGA